MITNHKSGTLYVGVTSDLVKRIHEHRAGVADGFSKKYNLKLLVYYEMFEDPENAIRREKQIKKWNREWKVKLIEKCNPTWKDLYKEII